MGDRHGQGQEVQLGWEPEQDPKQMRGWYPHTFAELLLPPPPPRCSERLSQTHTRDAHSTLGGKIRVAD